MFRQFFAPRALLVLMSSQLRRFFSRVLPTLLLAGLAGFGATALRVPLPWMIGPLLLIAVLRTAGLPLLAPRGGRQIGQWVIGTALGLYFSPAVIRELQLNFGVIASIAAGALALGVVGALVLLRWGRVDAPTAFFAALPGGASEMATLAERAGAAVERVAAAHALRVLLVVSTVPFALIHSGAHGSDLFVPLSVELDWSRFPRLLAASLAGVAVLFALRVPNAWVLGPLAGVGGLTALAVPLTVLPPWLLNAGQLLIACSLGVRFSPKFFRVAPRFMTVAAGSAYLSMLLAAGLAALLSNFCTLPFSTLALAAAPGGIAEMSITAKVLQLGVPMITVTHVLRVVLLSLSAPVVCPWFVRLTRRCERVATSRA